MTPNNIKKVFILVCVIQALSCTKRIDQKPLVSASFVTSGDATISNEFSNCKLRRIYQSYGPMGATVNGLFTYNHAGNPISVTFGPDLADNFYFTYDNLDRLRNFRSYDALKNLYTDHFYGFDANNRIVKDTSITSEQATGNYRYVSTLTYDSQGRIIKENIRNYQNSADFNGNVPPLQPDRNPTYTYDLRGNLGVSGWKSSSYDNKVSIFRSHPTFQFIHRNYSMNNSSVQTKYNSKGLPLSVIPGNDVFFSQKNVTKAIYDCD